MSCRACDVMRKPANDASRRIASIKALQSPGGSPSFRSPMEQDRLLNSRSNPFVSSPRCLSLDAAAGQRWSSSSNQHTPARSCSNSVNTKKSLQDSTLYSGSNAYAARCRKSLGLPPLPESESYSCSGAASKIASSDARKMQPLPFASMSGPSTEFH